MVARITTIAFQGVDVQSIDVQVQISNGLPAFAIVGLPDKAVAESKERVRTALHALGIALPAKRLTVNLAPAEVMKEGSHYDLPIASSAHTLFLNAAERMKLSARAYHRLLKVALTIADLAENTEITQNHVAENLSYRRLRAA